MDLLKKSSNGNSIVMNDADKNENLPIIDTASGAASLTLTPENVTKMIQHANGLDAPTMEFLSKRRSILSRLFPSELDKVLEKARISGIKQSVDHMLSINEALHQTSLRQLKALCNYNTKTVELALSTNLTNAQTVAINFIVTQMTEMHKEIDKIIIDECRWIDGIENPTYKECRMKELEQKMIDVCDEYALLRTNFLKILNSDNI